MDRPNNISILILLAMFYLAIKAYQGEEIETPILSEFTRNQGWV